jgi:hypothetical protein
MSLKGNSYLNLNISFPDREYKPPEKEEWSWGQVTLWERNILVKEVEDVIALLDELVKWRTTPEAKDKKPSEREEKEAEDREYQERTRERRSRE